MHGTRKGDKQMASTTFKFSEDMGNMQFYCGLDIHKHQLEVAIFGRDDSGHEFTKDELFSMDPEGLKSFWGFVKPYRPVMFAMEATNVYHHMVALFLDEQKKSAKWTFECMIVPPADAASLPGKPKNDRVDAERLARYVAAGLLHGGKPIVLPLEDLRALFRAAWHLECEMTAMKNRIKKQLDRGGFRPEKLNLDATWVRDFLHGLAGYEGTVGSYFTTCMNDTSTRPISKKLLEKNRSLFERFFDVQLSLAERALVRQEIVELEFKTARKALLAVDVDRIIMVRPALKQLVENVASIPGISMYTATWLVAEIGPIQRYPSVKNFVSYCGCCAREVSSANVVYSAHLTRRSNKHVRTMLFNAAKSVCTIIKGDSALKTYAQRVIARKSLRGPKLSWCIVAQKIARIIYGIMCSNMPFDSTKACNLKKHHDDPGKVLSFADKKTLRRARNALRRVATIDNLKLISLKAKVFADALDDALREN